MKSLNSKLQLPKVLPNDDGIRPAGRPDQCFYCASFVGQPHKLECVCIHKKVNLRLTVEYEVEVPYSWDKEQIEFHRNDGTWCVDNALNELTAYKESVGCLCNVSKIEYVDVHEPEPYSKEAK